MSKKILILFLLSVVTLMAQACKKDPIEDPIAFTIPRDTITSCERQLARQKQDRIPIQSVVVENATLIGHTDQFIDPCKTKEQAPIALTEGERATYQITFVLDAIYPIGSMDITNYLSNQDLQIKTLSVDVSIEPRAYQRVVHGAELTEDTTTFSINAQARYIRLTFSSTEGIGNHAGDYFGLNDVRFYVGEGYIVLEDDALSMAFRRYEGWTGADGIFSYNLTNGENHIGSMFERMLLIFSDTIISTVNPDTGIRQQGWKIINNTFGYYTPSETFEEGLSFVYEGTLLNPGNVYDADHYIGYHPSNLTDFDGFTITHTPNALLTNIAQGRMWRTDQLDQTSITLDLGHEQDVQTLYLWNDNVNPTYGIKEFELFIGNDAQTLQSIGQYTLPIAPQENNTPYQLSIDLQSVQTRFIKLVPINNHQLVPTHYALGKLMIESTDARILHAQSTATSYLAELDNIQRSARLWLQDSVIIGDTLYNFPIVVKDFETYFKVHQVGMTKTPIIDGVVDYKQATFLTTPLQARTEDGGEIFYGAGVLNMSNHPIIDDPYIYIYGYKDLFGRHLTVARVLPENIENFNAWTYFDGTNFQPDIRQSQGLIRGVSAELSVNYIPEGDHAGQYMLTVMENTISGRVSVSFSDTPYGPFEPFTLLYKTQELHQMNQVTVYNAKIHPLLSTSDEWVISYNVNGTSLLALRHVRVYHPRFLRIIVVS